MSSTFFLRKGEGNKHLWSTDCRQDTLSIDFSIYSHNGHYAYFTDAATDSEVERLVEYTKL